MFGKIFSSVASTLLGRIGRDKTSADVPNSQPPAPEALPARHREEESQSLSEMIREAAKTSTATAIGTALGTRVSNFMMRPDSVAKLAGKSHRAFYKAAFPGVTSWDALGGQATSASGSVSMVDKTNQANIKIARINANAKIRASEIAARGVPSIVAQRLEQTKTEAERRQKIMSETAISKTEQKMRAIELQYLDRFQRAELSYKQSRNLLQQWRQATGDVMTDSQASLISAAAQTVGAAVVTGYVMKQLANKVPIVRIMSGINKLIPKGLKSQFMKTLQELRRRKYLR